MRKFIHYFLIFVIVFVSIGSCTACNVVPEQDNEPKTFVVEFGSQPGGKIAGDTCQTVNEGGSTQKVVAIADIGYYFAGWADTAGNSDETVTRGERIIENVMEDCYFYAMFSRITLQVKYIAGENGDIIGELVQSGKYGDEASSITAIPNRGYRFVSWSDGLTEPTRKDQFIENKQITANFEIITNVYTYNYKFADGNCDEESIELTYGQLDNVCFSVPWRAHATFDGWYADRYLTHKVSDENGNAIIDNELFYNYGTQLYAKWISENTRKYKILIVYVTELNAELTTVDGKDKIQVNYTMSELERQICQMITEKISFELNDLAVADFQVDEYFTTVPLTKENIQETYAFYSGVDHKVYAYDIPEVQGLLQDYDSVLTSFSMDDYFGDLHDSAGEADSKFGSINFDVGLAQLIYYNEPFENLLDPYHFYWDAMIDTYLHEFAHTIELCVNNVIQYHKVMGVYLFDTDQLISQKLYFLNKAVVDGKTVGVPYEYWEGKVAEVYYQATDGGMVHKVSGFHINVLGHIGDTQYVLHGDDALSVIAIPQDGYEFAGWSDGVESATRHDTNIVEDLHVYAIFKPKE